MTVRFDPLNISYDQKFFESHIIQKSKSEGLKSYDKTKHCSVINYLCKKIRWIARPSTHMGSVWKKMVKEGMKEIVKTEGLGNEVKQLENLWANCRTFEATVVELHNKRRVGNCWLTRTIGLVGVKLNKKEERYAEIDQRINEIYQLYPSLYKTYSVDMIQKFFDNEKATLRGGKKVDVDLQGLPPFIKPEYLDYIRFNVDGQSTPGEKFKVCEKLKKQLSCDDQNKYDRINRDMAHIKEFAKICEGDVKVGLELIVQCHELGVRPALLYSALDGWNEERIIIQDNKYVYSPVRTLAYAQNQLNLAEKEKKTQEDASRLVLTEALGNPVHYTLENEKLVLTHLEKIPPEFEELKNKWAALLGYEDLDSLDDALGKLF